MALTLLMMAAVVSVFANISRSVSNRRASIEMTGQIRNTRGVLQRDLEGATCPGITWQRTDSNHGYIEVIEGPRADFDPSIWLQDRNDDGQPDDIDGNAGPLEPIDLATSTLPSSNLARLPGSTTLVTTNLPNAATDGGALGDWDDILMLTVRNESEPFVGRAPDPSHLRGSNSLDFPQQTQAQDDGDGVYWAGLAIQSTLAEVVWFAVENPVEVESSFYFGEPGMRTIYRRALLIAPHLNYAFNIGGQITGPGVVRVLAGNIDQNEVDQAHAALIAFQERYDLSVRLEWDALLAGGRWKIVANSLADLTKRENRYEHFGLLSATQGRVFPYPAAGDGAGNPSSTVTLVPEPEYNSRTANISGAAVINRGQVLAYRMDGPVLMSSPSGFVPRPLAILQGDGATSPITVRAITDESGRVVSLTNGFVPLGGVRRGEDIMLSDALAFDLRVYDAKAPVLAEINSADGSQASNFPGSAIAPGDIGWNQILQRDGFNALNSPPATILSRGAYVDLGYYRLHQAFRANNSGLANLNLTELQAAQLVDFSVLADRPHLKSQMRPINPTLPAVLDSYRVYDTWSFHYENNGVNEDKDKLVNGVLRDLTAADEQLLADNNPTNDPAQLIDEGTNGFDDPSLYANAAGVLQPGQILGPDDLGERETSPPYDVPLRGVQVTLRAYEPDSRQIREVKVSQTFVPK